MTLEHTNVKLLNNILKGTICLSFKPFKMYWYSSVAGKENEREGKTRISFYSKQGFFFKFQPEGFHASSLV